VSHIVDAFRGVLGLEGVLDGDAIDRRYLADWSGMVPARPLAVVLPRTTADVSALLRICHEASQPVVPQGGMTGLAGGAVPCEGDVCLSLERMAGIEEIDQSAGTMTVLAGTTLEQIQEAAAKFGFDFVLDMGSRSGCRIGGVLATNAGGIHVLQSGSAREQLLGVEVVLADGTVLTSLNKMMKNNAGYDLKYLFVGSEGTLGVITRAVLRLRSKPVARHTALCALDDYDAALNLFRTVRSALGAELSAFELMWEDFFDFGMQSPSSPRASFFDRKHAIYALVEQTSFDRRDAGERLSEALSGAVEAGAIADAVIPHSVAETRALWRIRESTAEFAGRLVPLNFDVSLPIGEIGRFAEECRAAIEARWPGHRSYRFGHLGDSNLHVTVDLRSIPGVVPAEVEQLVYSQVERYRGSVSAEHGIGLLKRNFLGLSRTEAELQTMWAIKMALDPRNILNRGKVLAGR
jgi:FAD/FMN-containing dehydrogenase